MIIAQLAFRAWALYPSWFFLDDYNLLHDAARHRLDVDYLLTAYNGHLMPGGRLLVWIVAESGPVNWGLAATFTLALQALASIAALWMVTTLFGPRTMALVPLVLYLTSAMTVPALIWWSAALTLLPLQVAFFAALGCWVRYLRGRSWTWLAGATLSVLGGLLFDVKGVLVLPVMVFVAVAYFSPGPTTTRLTHAVRHYWPAAVVGSLVLGLYAAYYLVNVPQIVIHSNFSVTARIAGSMLGQSFPTGALGGPWRWILLAPPTAFADPPAWVVSLSWVVLVLLVGYGALRRRNTLRAWFLLAGYLVILLILVADSRGEKYAAIIGLEYRYLTDATGVLALCVGLAFLPLVGATESSRPRAEPLLRLQVTRLGLAGMLVVVAGSGVVSSVKYANYWHSDNASDAYMHNLQTDLRSHGAVDLAETTVPDTVLSQLTAPLNTSRRLAPLVSSRVSFPDKSPVLAVVGADGGLRQALIQLGVASQPGPVENCGWSVEETGRRIPLQGNAFRWQWWVRVGYVASADSPVTVKAGVSTVQTSVETGVNSLYVKVDGAFRSVGIDGLARGVTLCVDTIEVGQPVAGGPLP